MLFSTPQMSSYHSLAEHPIHLSVGDKPLERVHSIKLLGVNMTDTLKWDDHVKHLDRLILLWCPSCAEENQELYKLPS